MTGVGPLTGWLPRQVASSTNNFPLNCRFRDKGVVITRTSVASELTITDSVAGRGIRTQGSPRWTTSLPFGWSNVNPLCPGRFRRPGGLPGARNEPSRGDLLETPATHLVPERLGAGMILQSAPRSWARA
jgi:hypothetical protein